MVVRFLIDPDTELPHIDQHGVMKKVKAKRPRKDPNVYPPGWSYQRAKVIADYYDSVKGEDLLGQESTAKTLVGLVWMEVPQELVPQVRKLIAKGKKTA